MLKLTTLSLKNITKTNRGLLVCLFSLYFGQTQGQTHSFSGTIGKYAIYLQVNITGSDVSGYYFYKNKLIDIPFIGTYKAGLITINTTNAFGEISDNKEVFKFKWPNKAPAGTWTNKGKSLELKLLPLTAKETGSPKCTNPYFTKDCPEINNPNMQLKKVKVGLFKLKEDRSPQIINKVKIRHFTELNTGISLFRIDSGLVAEKQKDANLYLENFQVSEFLSSLECASYSPVYEPEYGFNTSNISISNDFISFAVFTAYYCGGAHPEEYNYGVNFNLNTHRKIESGDYLISGKEDAFGILVFDYLSQTYPEYFSTEVTEDNLGCEYYRPELWTANSDFSFTEEGIKFLPSFAHYMAPCLDPEWAIVPYSELKEVIKPDYYNKLKQLKP